MSFGPASPDAGVELLRQLFLQCAGFEARGGDLVLLGADLELEGAQAALEDCVGAVVERREWRHVAAPADPDAVRGPQVRRQVLWQLSVRCNVVSRQRRRIV